MSFERAPRRFGTLLAATIAASAMTTSVRAQMAPSPAPPPPSFGLIMPQRPWFDFKRLNRDASGNVTGCEYDQKLGSFPISSATVNVSGDTTQSIVFQFGKSGSMTFTPGKMTIAGTAYINAEIEADVVDAQILLKQDCYQARHQPASSESSGLKL